MWAGPNPPGPVLPPEGYPATDLDVGNGVQRASGSLLQPSTAAKYKIKATPAVNTSTPLSLQCMVCNAAPTVGTRPTVTMCGHIFCSEYVPGISGSVAVRLTPQQVYHTARNVDPQLSCVRQRPVAVLLIQTRSPGTVVVL